MCGVLAIELKISRAFASSPALSRFDVTEGFHVFRRIFFSGEDGPHHSAEECGGSHVVGEPYGNRNRSGGSGFGDTEQVRQQIGHYGCHHGAKPYKNALHGEPAGTLFLRQQIGNEGAKWLHADVDGGVEDPKQTRGHPQCRGIRHEYQRYGTEDCAAKEVGTAPPQAIPGVIAHMTDDRLDNQTGQRRCEPENRNLLGPCAKVFVNGAHVRHLQPPAKLNPQEPEAHVPDLPKAEPGLVHGCSDLTRWRPVASAVVQHRKFFQLGRMLAFQITRAKSPLPVAFPATRQIHARGGAETKYVLQRNQNGVGNG